MNLFRAADLIKSFKRIAVDQTHIASQNFFLREYLEDVITSVHSLYKEGNHHCEIDCPEDIMLFGPPGSIAQIFTNLINNSVKHGFENRKGGQIRISCHINKDLVQIEYSDNGQGIPEEHIDKLFNPFFTTKLGKGGSGLGLSITYNQIHKLWGGTITCESQLGEGTRFLIDFPLRGQAESSRESNDYPLL